MTGGAGSMRMVATGLLGLLPVHAAWTADAETPGRRRYLLDDVAIAYTPNSRATAFARRAAEHARDEKLLLITDPVTGRHPRLALAEAQASALTRCFPAVSRLSGKDVTPHAVLEALGPAYVHLACHGVSFPERPLEGALILSDDEPLTVRALLEAAPGRYSRLVTLAACETFLP